MSLEKLAQRNANMYLKVPSSHFTCDFIFENDEKLVTECIQKQE